MDTDTTTSTEDLVFANASAMLHLDGLPYRVIAGTAWKANDPLVKRWPGFFAARPLPEHISSVEGEPPPPWARVEQATTAPGEARNPFARRRARA